MCDSLLFSFRWMPPPLCQSFAKISFRAFLPNGNTKSHTKSYFLWWLSFLCICTHVLAAPRRKNNCINSAAAQFFIVMNLYAWDINNNNKNHPKKRRMTRKTRKTADETLAPRPTKLKNDYYFILFTHFLFAHTHTHTSSFIVITIAQII